MLGMLVLAITDLRRLVKVADITAAMSVEGLLGTDDVFAADLHALRPHPGKLASAANLRALMALSEIREPSHQGLHPGPGRLLAALLAAGAGAVRDTIDPRRHRGRIELGSAIDNPVVTPDGRVESNGNFHGAPLAYVLDFLAIAVADLASIAERRTDRFLDPPATPGLPRSWPRTPASTRPHDRPVHPGGHRVGAEAARPAGFGRLHPQLGDAGGPRVDGLVRRT